MAKGFGTPINKILGYVLLLYPSLKVYAALQVMENHLINNPIVDCLCTKLT